MSAHVGDSVGGEDIELVFPTGPDRFHALIAELSSGQGGEGHTYEVMASWAKSPVSYNRDEIEPNDSPQDAQTLASGDTVFGWLSDAIDSDWFSVDLAAGKQTVVIDVSAWERGSAGDFKVLVFDEADTLLGVVYGGEMGWERDPWVSLTVPGNQTLHFRIAEQANRSSEMCWYTVHVDITGAS
jgi:hypothetical protein